MEGLQEEIFNSETVLHNYNLLSHGHTKELKRQANQYIISFIQSEQAWQVAESLLNLQQPIENQFIGAQALYQKLQQNLEIFDDDNKIQSLRDNLFRLLQKNNDGYQYQKIVVERLCMSISYIAIKTCNTCWNISIQNIIQYGSVNTEQCYISLMILKNIPIIYDHHSFDIKTTNVIQNFLRENLIQVLDYLNKIIIQQNLPKECYFEGLTCGKHWCVYSSKTFIPHDEFISNIIKLLDNEEVYKKIVNIIKKLLVHSKYVKLMDNCNFSQIFTSIPQKDQQFLQIIIEYLIKKRDIFFKTSQLFDNIDMDQYENLITFAEKYSSLLVIMCSNYELLLLNDNGTSQALFQLLIDCASHQNLKISQSSLEFWDEFKETIQNNIIDLQNNQSIFKPYIELCKIMLVQCKRSDLSDEQEQEIKGMSVSRYRDFAFDVFFKGFYLFKKIFKEEGQNTYFRLFLEQLRNQDPFVMESGIFAAKSILDAIDNQQNEIAFIKEVIIVILQSQYSVNHLTFIRTSVGFIYECSVYYNLFNDLLGDTLKLLIKQAEFDEAKDLVYKTIFELSQQCREKFGKDDILLIYNHLQNNFKTLRPLQIGTLMEAICSICSMLEQQQLKISIYDTQKIAINILTQIDNQTINQIDRDDICKSLVMLIGCIKALDTLSFNILKEVLLPMIQQIWPNLCLIGETRYQDKEIIEYICNFIQKVIKALNIEMIPLFDQLAKTLINIFNNNPQNVKCLRIFAFSCSVLGKQQYVQQFLNQSFDDLLKIIVGKLFENEQMIDKLNVDIIMSLIEILNKVSEIDINILFKSNYFNDLINLLYQTCIQVNEKDTNNQIILFFSHLLANREGGEMVQQYMDQIVMVMFFSVSKDSGQLHEKISSALVYLMHSAITNGYVDKVKESILVTLQKQEFGQIPEKVRYTLVNLLFTFKGDKRQIRLILITLNGYVNNLLKEDAFLGLELQAQKLNKMQAGIQGQSFNKVIDIQ